MPRCPRQFPPRPLAPSLPCMPASTRRAATVHCARCIESHQSVAHLLLKTPGPPPILESGRRPTTSTTETRHALSSPIPSARYLSRSARCPGSGIARAGRRHPGAPRAQVAPAWLHAEPARGHPGVLPGRGPANAALRHADGKIPDIAHKCEQVSYRVGKAMTPAKEWLPAGRGRDPRAQGRTFFLTQRHESNHPGMRDGVDVQPACQRAHAPAPACRRQPPERRRTDPRAEIRPPDGRRGL
ncbi:hypothetical protein CBM2587_B60065 [Cupriavidus taiwanensis]|uniref:Uncharacterized protein n=1 Tax=Cupriavidus taiwanensis TaxID=164546 RepID=A0A375C566_9BURK|nr:hypothetical protein CBM2587_B60065 [Cupriavidus taiwanensis]